jgi:hypothetical protein
VSAGQLVNAAVGDEAWWVAQLDGVSIPLDVPAGADAAGAAAHLRSPLETGQAQLETAVLALMARYGATGRVAMTVEVDGDWLPVVVDLEPEPTFPELAQRLGLARREAACPYRPSSPGSPLLDSRLRP